jgi:NADP-dependent 3-hydroxy acid dehydrogenase YdfG
VCSRRARRSAARNGSGRIGAGLRRQQGRAPGGVATDLLRTVRTGLGRPYDPALCVSPDSLATVLASVMDAPADVDITEIALQPPSPPGGR